MDEKSKPDLSSRPERGMSIIRICRGCGCTDDHACEGGCSWVLMDFVIRLKNKRQKVIPVASGVCSRCAEVWEWHPMAMAV